MPSYLTDQPLDSEDLLAQVATRECGATALFLGTVRSSKEDGDISGIDYSAYPEMAEAEFGRIIGEAGGRWPGARIAVKHRLGVIRTGEASIGIAVAAPHRDEAYECSRYLIEEIKKRVPIWKKEHFRYGEPKWVGAAHAR